MSIVIAVDDSSIAEAVCRAVAPNLIRNQETAHLMTVLDPGEVHGQRRGNAPAQYTSEAAPADLSGGVVSAGATRGPQLPSTAEDRSQAMAIAEDERRRALERLAAQHLAGVTCEFHVAAGDDVATVIAEFAEQVDADSIAIGTHGRTGIRHFLSGSVAESVIRKAGVPVLVVREGMRVSRE